MKDPIGDNDSIVASYLLLFFFFFTKKWEKDLAKLSLKKVFHD